MSETLTPRQIQEMNRFYTTDNFSGEALNLINLVSYSYVAIKLIKNPQTHLVILCVFFGSAALAEAGAYTLYLINVGQYSEAVSILASANLILFCVGHWKFVFQFFVSAVDTKNILWNGTEWHIRQIILYKGPLDWVVTTLIILSMLACILA